MIIQHQYPKENILKFYFYRFFMPKYFWETKITDDGIVISQLFGGLKIIPWDQILHLDLFALESKTDDHNLKLITAKLSGWAKGLFKVKSFLVMTKKSKDIKSILKFTAPKTSLAAANVLRISYINPEQCQPLCELLIKKAQVHQIKLTQIILDF